MNSTYPVLSSRLHSPPTSTNSFFKNVATRVALCVKNVFLSLLSLSISSTLYTFSALNQTFGPVILLLLIMALTSSLINFLARQNPHPQPLPPPPPIPQASAPPLPPIDATRFPLFAKIMNAPDQKQTKITTLLQSTGDPTRPPLPSYYFCPITFALIQDPVQDPTPEGQQAVPVYYERQEIESWLTKQKISPITRKELTMLLPPDPNYGSLREQLLKPFEQDILAILKDN